jgi:hypothetical protein
MQAHFPKRTTLNPPPNLEIPSSHRHHACIGFNSLAPAPEKAFCGAEMICLYIPILLACPPFSLTVDSNNLNFLNHQIFCIFDTPHSFNFSLLFYILFKMQYSVLAAVAAFSSAVMAYVDPTADFDSVYAPVSGGTFSAGCSMDISWTITNSTNEAYKGTVTIGLLAGDSQGSLYAVQDIGSSPKPQWERMKTNIFKAPSPTQPSPTTGSSPPMLSTRTSMASPSPSPPTPPSTNTRTPSRFPSLPGLPLPAALVPP